jgi:hypothetical protein
MKLNTDEGCDIITLALLFTKMEVCMSLRQYRISLEYTFTIDELTDERARESMKHFSNYQDFSDDPETQAHIERQRRLLAALLANSRALETYVLHRVSDLLQAEGGQLASEALAVDQDEEDILQPVINSLSKEDAAYFREVISNGLLIENTEELSEVFQLDLVNAEIVEVDPPQVNLSA